MADKYQVDKYHGQQESIKMENYSGGGQIPRYEFFQPDSSIDNTLGTYPYGTDDENNYEKILKSPAEISIVNFPPDSRVRNGAIVYNTGDEKPIENTDKKGRSSYHIFTTDEITCYTQWFAIDPSVWIKKGDVLAHPVVAVNVIGGGTKCLRCIACVGCTSCYNCYDQIFNCTRCVGGCDEYCVSGCYNNCTSGCTSGCIGGNVACNTDERSWTWNTIDKGCTPSSQGCDAGCYGPGAQEVDSCGPNVEYRCNNLTAMDELCDECRFACQGGCQAMCQTCTTDGGSVSCDFTPCVDFDCPDCNSCTSPCYGVSPNDPSVKPCRHDTGIDECGPPCVGTVARLPEDPDRCRNGLNISDDDWGTRFTHLNPWHEHIKCTGGTVSCKDYTSSFEALECTNNAKIGCYSQNNSITDEEFEEMGDFVEKKPCLNNIDGYIWCRFGRIGYEAYICEGDCNTSNWGIMRYGKRTTQGPDRNTPPGPEPELVPNPIVPPCKLCDDWCVSGCDGSCTSGCQSCTGNTSMPCSTTSPCPGFTPCPSGCYGAPCVNWNCVVCTAGNENCGSGESCPNHVNDIDPDYCSCGLTSNVAPEKPKEDDDSSSGQRVSPNIFTPTYC